MKRSRTTVPSRFNGLSIFAGERLQTCDELIQRTQEMIQGIKHTYHNKSLTFDYDNEEVRGKFVDAVEGDFPGTYMIVLKLASSRVCSGPCFVHLGDERIGAIVVTGKHGLVGITAKAVPHRKMATIDSELTRCA